MRNVTALLNVLAAPPLQPELSNLDITQEWLNENVASGLEANECRFTQEQKALFVSTFTNLQEVKAVLPMFLNREARMIPRLWRLKSCEMARPCGSSCRLRSRTRFHASVGRHRKREILFQSFLGPITQPDKSFITYNADISRA
jgi:hypothetical protein